MEIDAWVAALKEALSLNSIPTKLAPEELSVLKLMRRRKGTHGYTTFSFARKYALDEMGGEWSVETVLTKLKSNKLILEETIHGERVYFITELGMEEAKVAYKDNLKSTELKLVDENTTISKTT